MQKCLRIKIKYLLVIGLVSLVLSSFCKRNQLLTILFLFTGLFCFTNFFVINFKKRINTNTNSAQRIKSILKCSLSLLIFFLFLISLYKEETYYFSKVLLFHFHEKFGYLFEKDYSQYRCEDCNIILISIDTLRADHLPCYGYYRNTAPNLCKFAEGSMLFEDTVSHASNSMPSHMSMFTSLYPFSHGVNTILKDKLDDKTYTLPQILKLYNYTNAWFGPLTNPVLSFEAGFGRGFDEKFDTPIKDDPYVCDHSEFFEWTSQQKNDSKKFFAFYHTYYVHALYVPPMNLFYNGTSIPIRRQLLPHYGKSQILSYAKRRLAFDSQQFFIALNISDKALQEMLLSPDFWSDNNSDKAYEFISMQPAEQLITLHILPNDRDNFWNGVNLSNPEEIAYVVSLYDSEITYADYCLRELFEYLNSQDFSDSTMLIITSDHGESFMEHGEIEHTSLYEEVLHVPLIIKAPWLNSGRCAALVESIDIMPTILLALGIPLPYYTQGKNLLICNPKDFAYSTNPPGFKNNAALTSAHWTLLNLSNGKTELYDRVNDPKQKADLSAEKPEIATKLKSQLNTFVESAPKYYSKTSEFSPLVDNETRENIIRTGYW